MNYSISAIEQLKMAKCYCDRVSEKVSKAWDNDNDVFCEQAIFDCIDMCIDYIEKNIAFLEDKICKWKIYNGKI